MMDAFRENELDIVQGTERRFLTYSLRCSATDSNSLAPTNSITSR